MRNLGKDQLLGWRTPTAEERERIRRYLVCELEKRRIQYGRTFAFLMIVGITFLFSVLYNILKNKGMTAEVAIVMGVTLLVLWAAKGSMSESRMAKELRRYVENGEFAVMDCTSEEFETDVDMCGIGAVFLRDKYDRLCSDRFLIDYATARKYCGKQKIPLLLMYQKECQYYRVFSGAMLGR